MTTTMKLSWIHQQWYDLDDCADGDIDDTIDGDNLDDNDSEENYRVIVRDTSSSYRPALPQERALPLCSEVPCLTRFAFVHLEEEKNYFWSQDPTRQPKNNQPNSQSTKQPSNQPTQQPINKTTKHQITNQSTTSVLTPTNCPPRQALAARAGGLRTPLLEDDRESCV